MKHYIISRLVCLILLITYFFLPIIIQSHGFCEHAIIKHSHAADKAILTVCRKVVRKKKICIPSYDTHTHTHVSHKKVKKGGQSKVPWHVRLSCSPVQQHPILCSPLQEFYCVDTNEWMPAYQLCIGDRLLSYHGPRDITCMEFVEKKLKIYALEVEPPHTFFVGQDALLTHNMELPTAWIAFAPAITFGSGAALSVGGGAVAGSILAPIIAPAVILTGLALSGALGALVDACCNTVPTYHAAVDGIQSLFGSNQSDNDKQGTKQENKQHNADGSGGGPKKNDADKDKIKFSENENDARHIFRDKENHIQKDTPEARRMLEELVNNQSNYQGSDKFGTRWFSKILENGEQLWAKVGSNNRIKNAGINKIPKSYDPVTGLCRSLKITEL